MTDVVEKMMPDLHARLWDALTDRVDAEGQIDRDTSIPAMLATLTPGSTWTTDDGVEVMVVPVEATGEMLGALEGVNLRCRCLQCDANMATQYAERWQSALSAIRKE